MAAMPFQQQPTARKGQVEVYLSYVLVALQVLVDVALIGLAITVQSQLPTFDTLGILPTSRALWAICTALPLIHIATRPFFFPYILPCVPSRGATPRLGHRRQLVAILALCQLVLSATSLLLSAFWKGNDTINNAVVPEVIGFAWVFYGLQWAQMQLDLLTVIVIQIRKGQIGKEQRALAMNARTKTNRQVGWGSAEGMQYGYGYGYDTEGQYQNPSVYGGEMGAEGPYGDKSKSRMYGELEGEGLNKAQGVYELPPRETS